MANKKPAEKKSKKWSSEDLQSPRSHEIEEQSRALFMLKKPSHWIPADLKPDYGKDYHVELKDPAAGRAVTGGMFYVQVKGAEKGSYPGKKKSESVFPIERKYSKHWSTVIAPVFLVVYDLQTQKGYWLYVQEFLAKNPRWRTHSKFRYRIPLSQSFDDLDKLNDAVTKAIRERRILAASAGERLQHDAAALEKLDPRFEAIPHVFGNKQSYFIVPRGDDAILHGSIAAQHADAILRGDRVHIKPDEIDFDDSDLFKHLASAGCVIQQQPVVADMTLSIHGKQTDHDVPALVIPCHLTGNNSVCYIRSVDEGCPLSFNIGPWKRPDPGETPAHNVRFGLDLRRWNNLPLLTLPYCEPLSALLGQLMPGCLLLFTCRYKGNLICRSSVTPLVDSPLLRLAPLVGLVEKARQIALAAAHSMVLSLESLTKDPFVIRRCYDLLTEKKWESPPCLDLDITLTVAKKSTPHFPSHFDPTSSEFHIYTPSYEEECLGCRLPMGDVIEVYSGIQILSSAEELAACDGDHWPVRIRLSSNSLYRVERLSAEQVGEIKTQLVH
jgi:hypothetical protein